MTITKSGVLNYVEAILLIYISLASIFALSINGFSSLWNIVTGKNCSIKYTYVIGGLIMQGSTVWAL